MQPRSAWIPELDGVRGVAVAAVVVHHVYPWESFGYPLSLLGLGWGGVDLFFVLSGFLITGILVDTVHQRGFWIRFATRRALRILPLYWPLVAALLVWHLVDAAPTAAPWWAYPLFLCNWWIAWMPSFDDLPLNVSWSLAIEEQFYLTWPPLVRWLPRLWLVGTLAATLLLAPVARLMVGGPGYLPAYVLTPCRADAIAWGCAALLAWRAGGRWVSVPAAAAGPLVASLAVAALTVGLDRESTWYLGVGYTLFSASAAAALLAILSGRWTSIGRWLRAPWLVAVGRVSFGIYLLHPLALKASHALCLLLAARVGEVAAMLAHPALSVALTLAMAAASWRWLERPALSLKDRVARYTDG